jgi:hypothetical protein
MYLTDQLNDTPGFLDLALSLCGEVSCADNKRDFWDATLAKNLGVAEREEVEDRGGVGLLVGEVLFALLEGNKGPELCLLVEVQLRLIERN